MDRIECMRAFVETVRANSFSAAARVLDVPRSKISKQVQALEELMGVQLLTRTTRSLNLTSTGAEYYEAALDVLASIEEAEQRAREGMAQLRGTLRINAPVSFGIRVLAPLLPAFHALHPEVQLQLVLNDRQIDPVRGGHDVTIRIADLPDSTLVARCIMPAPRILVAAPAYLQRAGQPQTPDDLIRHACLIYGAVQGSAVIALLRGNEIQRIHVQGPLIADNGDVLKIAAEAGMGIALLPAFIIDDSIRAGRLTPVLPQWHAPPISVNAVYPSTRRLPQKTRRFIDFLISTLGQPELESAVKEPAV